MGGYKFQRSMGLESMVIVNCWIPIRHYIISSSNLVVFFEFGVIRLHQIWQIDIHMWLYIIDEVLHATINLQIWSTEISSALSSTWLYTTINLTESDGSYNNQPHGGGGVMHDLLFFSWLFFCRIIYRPGSFFESFFCQYPSLTKGRSSFWGGITLFFYCTVHSITNRNTLPSTFIIFMHRCEAKLSASLTETPN